MSEEILKQIEINTRPKSSHQILLSSNETRFTTRFSPALELKKGKEYKIALVNLETYYSFPKSKVLIISLGTLTIQVPHGQTLSYQLVVTKSQILTIQYKE